MRIVCPSFAQTNTKRRQLYGQRIVNGKRRHSAYLKRIAPPSPIVKDTSLAFLTGGAICALGQLIQNGFLALGLSKSDAGTAVSITLIFLSALLTGLNRYNSIARFAGAGTLVPITGFANSVVSPAIDCKSED